MKANEITEFKKFLIKNDAKEAFITNFKSSGYISMAYYF
jgi:hypothetical protein